MVKGAIFDFDGTLFDSMSVWANMGESYLNFKGITPKDNVNEKFVGMGLKNAAKYFQTEYGVTDSSEKIIEDINSLAEPCYFNEVQPKEGLSDFLERLRENGIKMCVCTATDKYMIEAALKRCNLSEYFEFIITCTEVGYPKSNPAVFRKALELLETEKQNSYVFEDYSVAAKTAKTDGFNVVGIYDIYERNPEKLKAVADFYIESYTDLNGFYRYFFKGQA